MDTLASRHLTTLTVAVDWKGIIDTGSNANGRRRFAPVAGGRFEGERLSGSVLPGGSDWVFNRPDSAMIVDVRLPLRTDDGAMLSLAYRGVMRATPEAMARFGRGASLAADEYQLRTIASFETGDPRYLWLNDLLAIGVSGPTTADTRYVIHEIL
ncbi:MAG: hypothetical protein CFE37_06290 [Alphaproteobacteria bacterium PA4]|nr:MAG: hypothetical protein CFE37_06290 [Alphaproteobacteria bacterium PA4]